MNLEPIDTSTTAGKAEGGIVYQVRSAPEEGWSDASKRRYDSVGNAMLLPLTRHGPRWQRRIIKVVSPFGAISGHGVTLNVEIGNDQDI